MSTWRNLFLIVMLAGFVKVQAQADSTVPPYKRFPTYPPVQLLLSDSTSFFSKKDVPAGKSVFLVVFSPECSHCQTEAEQIYANRENLKNIQIVMATMHPLWMMKQFIKNYHLDEMQNVVVGRDIHYLTQAFFSIRHLPFYALYNKKGQLVKAGDGNIDVGQVPGLLN